MFEIVQTKKVNKKEEEETIKISFFNKFDY